MLNLEIENFSNVLECGEPYDLHEMVRDFPEELRLEAVKKFIEVEVQFFQTKGWTYNLARHEEFPELRQYLMTLINGSSELSIDDFKDDGVKSRHVAQCDYRVDRWPFAEGGQGVLYRACDAVLGERDVAVKILKRPEDEKRFRQEAVITAGLDHPGIAAVYAYSENGKQENEGGELIDGRPFYAMRLIDGRPLDDGIAEFQNKGSNSKTLLHDTDFVRLIESLISACHTVAYAHSVGVMHCDIKPQNIMCGKFGATIVLDWGSAVSAPSTVIRTNDKQIACPDWTSDSLYTAAYASPEQRSGNETLDERSDVYSLGATLYQIISGYTPIDLNDFPDRKQGDQIGNVRSQQPNCPKPLNAICLKALKINPDDRYSSPTDFAEDLANWLRGEEITAQPDSVVDKVFRFVNQHRVASAISLLTVALLAFAGWRIQVENYKQYRLNQTVKNDELRLKSNLDSGFSLIENICEPLENGELQNREELETVAHLVHLHCDKHLGPTADVAADDQLLRGRLYKLRSLTHYFYEYYDGGNAPRSDAEDIDRIALAIADVDHSINLMEASRSGSRDVFVDTQLAKSSLFKARLHFQQHFRANASHDELAIALKSLDKTEQRIERLDDSAFEGRLREAEAYQLRGEILQRQVELVAPEDQNATTTETGVESARAFEHCIAVLEAIDTTDPADSLQVLRGLGRGYGYLGDMQRQQQQFDEAFGSYAQSLKYRKQIVSWDEENVESIRQLSRGYGNFMRTLRNLGVIPREDATQQELLECLQSDATDRLKLEAVELDAVPEARKVELIHETLQRYMGTDRNDSGSPSGLQLYRRIGKLGDNGSVKALADALNLIGELYFQAARHVPAGKQTELLESTLKYSNEARGLLEKLHQDAGDNKGIQNSLACSMMLEIQVKRLLGDPDANQDCSEVIRILRAESSESAVSNEELFMRCVALADGADSTNVYLEEDLKLLATNGFKHVWRMKQHFDPKHVKLFMDFEPK